MSGRFGELEDFAPGDSGLNANGKQKRRVWREVFGSVVGSNGLWQWNVRFDHDGKIREGISSNQLKIVPQSFGVAIEERVTVS